MLRVNTQGSLKFLRNDSFVELEGFLTAKQSFGNIQWRVQSQWSFYFSVTESFNKRKLFQYTQVQTYSLEVHAYISQSFCLLFTANLHILAKEFTYWWFMKMNHRPPPMRAINRCENFLELEHMQIWNSLLELHVPVKGEVPCESINSAVVWHHIL